MKFFTLKTTAVFLGGILLFSSCKHDNTEETPKATTVAQDKEAINNTVSNVLGCTRTMAKGDFIESVKSFMKTTEQGQIEDTWQNELLKSLFTKINLEDWNNSFPFSKIVGTYEYNTTTKEWAKDDKPSSKITLLFPSAPEITKNDMDFTISSYADTKITIDGEESSVPTKLYAKLKKNGKDLFYVDLRKITYSNNAPKEVDMTIFAAPFTTKFTLNDKGNSNYSQYLSLETEGGCKYELANDFNFDNGFITEHEYDGPVINSLKGHILYVDMKITYDIDVKALDKIEDPTTNDFKKYSKFELFINDSKIGDLEYRINGEEEKIMVIYKDGTEDDAYEKYLKDIYSEVESIWLNLTLSNNLS